MKGTRTGWGLVVAATLLALGMLSAGPAAADALCREECAEARRVCLRAAEAAHQVCRHDCEDDVALAVRRANAFCEEQGLEPEACRAVVERAVAAALTECREDCQRVQRLAREACQEERHECRRACDDVIDLGCASECREEFVGCADDLDACLGDCREQTREAVESCLQLGANSEIVEQCIRDARAEGRLCGVECHALHPCGQDRRACLEECVLDE